MVGRLVEGSSDVIVKCLSNGIKRIKKPKLICVTWCITIITYLDTKVIEPNVENTIKMKSLAVLTPPIYILTKAQYTECMSSDAFLSTYIYVFFHLHDIKLLWNI